MVFIDNFTNSRDLTDLEWQYKNEHGTNINFLLDDFKNGYTTWSVPKKATIGDTVVFMCAKEARNNLGMATSHMPDEYSDEFKTFVNEQKALYKKYSGYLLGYGTVSSMPEFDGVRWMSDIEKLHRFPQAVPIDEFRSFIFISRTNSITYLDNQQWERLKWVVNQNNPKFFDSVVPPYAETVNSEFENDVKKEMRKPIDSLRKQVQKRSSLATAHIVQTKVFKRDASIAAYVKKRANGHCQLCGKIAPFKTQDGEPYLECHHIEWLSNGGEDSIYNCVALCPNCHRKMHMVNDPKDIEKLKSSIKDEINQ